jgi:hypothetical protein
VEQLVQIALFYAWVLYRLEPLSLLNDLLKALDLITFSEIFPVVEAHTALAAFSHFVDIFLDVLEGVEGACRSVSQVSQTTQE